EPYRYMVRNIFFFQAEDGIRDFHVTGVQTCALPIWVDVLSLLDLWPVLAERLDDEAMQKLREKARERAERACAVPQRVEEGLPRSEERRVGKECGYEARGRA